MLKTSNYLLCPNWQPKKCLQSDECSSEETFRGEFSSGQTSFLILHWGTGSIPLGEDTTPRKPELAIPITRLLHPGQEGQQLRKNKV